jgi:phage portal protein BeeE
MSRWSRRREQEIQRALASYAEARAEQRAVGGTALYPGFIDPKTLTRQVWDASTARRIPGVGRALDLIGGLMSQMALDRYAGIMPLPRPRFLEQPDPDMDLATFTAVQVEDWLLHGNAAHMVTARYSGGPFAGWPAAGKWYPAQQWHTTVERGQQYWWLNGVEVDPREVVHVQNGANPMTPWIGMGVVERYLSTLDRIALQEERERQDTAGGQVPSVAVITPQKDPDEDDLDEAAEKWERKFRGPGRRPAILPNGTQVVPLGWSPNDAQATEARKLGLQDTANMFNLDGYWLGAPSSSHTYKSPGPLFLTLVRTTLGRIITPFEQRWSEHWMPRGTVVRFDREAIQADDLGSLVNTLTTATGNKPLMTQDEARTRLRLAPIGGAAAELGAPAAPPPPTEPPNPDDQDPTQDDTEEQD